MKPSIVRSGRDITAWTVTVLVCVLLMFALLAPTDVGPLSPRSFARIPVEMLVAVPVLLLVSERARRPVAAVLGAALGLVALVKIADLGFYSALDRAFHPAYDWHSFGPAVDLLTAEVGLAGAIALSVTAAALALGVVIASAAAMVRLTRVVVRHRTSAARTVIVLWVVWLGCAVTGLQIAPSQPIAARSAAAFAYDRAHQVVADIRDKREFARDTSVDAFHDVNGDELLTALRGKDVVVTFVESYGRVAVEHPDIAPRISAALDNGTRTLRTAGFTARSAYLTSPTVGGVSWLAHATLQSGLWVDNQLRYDTTVASDRLTLTAAFNRAGWRTVGVVPANTEDWSEREFYGFDGYYDSRTLGYRGPRFSFDTIPDQFTLAAFHRHELAGKHRPVMAEIDLTSSHWPWDQVPRYVPWADLGDGSVLADMPTTVSAPGGARAGYADNIEYTLRSLLSYVKYHGDDDLVLIVVGDHQPASMVTGEGSGRDVPISIIAADPAVFDRMDDWDWENGLRPGPSAPVWPMDDFRDRFLSAFGSPPA
ncbi:sulfatase [Haloechinothrix salitolerans]|uniref:Sulfatase n=1 Tax=Haloechinothrix salitolerans TaxID=926830 RepID=A0ABW2BWF0_9PSEU